MSLESINFDNDPDRVYSDIVKVDDKYLFLSGLVSSDLETGEILDGNISFQTNCVLNNLKTILENHNSDMNHVVRIEIILQNFSDRDEMNREYIKHFDKKHLPARLCFGDVSLAANLKIEIMVIAVIR